ncbi:FAD-dependent oxidoreductase [Actinosynnema sp. NPDC050801]|uniref:NAD(P)/FAD-dependent oxidoreductase n=1 Tax=unclassified Actinosynnema TaxID=2637065 RepID=UPI003404EE66
MTTPSDVLVVGASAAGLATVEALRRKGFTGGLTLLGDEVHPPYDRPPLSKQVLAGTWEPERARLRGQDALDALGATFVPGDPAVSLDVPGRGVRTAAGNVLRADAVVIATGVRARTLPDQAGLGGVHVLRTVGDAVALRAELLTAARLVVVGDGVLGAEVAATARGLGLDVTLAGPQPAPLAAQLGPLASGLLADLHTGHGVRLRLGAAVLGLTGQGGRVTGVRLDTGDVLPADVVVVALGAVPNTDWLLGSGLRIDDGVVCDARCRAAEGIYAVGDVARWHHERLGASLRLENRTNATEQAGVVADNVLGAERSYVPVPYFWTDQFDARLQVFGVLPAGAEVSVVDGDVTARRFVALHRLGGEPVGVLGWNMPKQARRHRQHLLGGSRPDRCPPRPPRWAPARARRQPRFFRITSQSVPHRPQSPPTNWALLAGSPLSCHFSQCPADPAELTAVRLVERAEVADVQVAHECGQPGGQPPPVVHRVLEGDVRRSADEVRDRHAQALQQVVPRVVEHAAVPQHGGGQPGVGGHLVGLDAAARLAHHRDLGGVDPAVVLAGAPGVLRDRPVDGVQEHVRVGRAGPARTAVRDDQEAVRGPLGEDVAEPRAVRAARAVAPGDDGQLDARRQGVGPVDRVVGQPEGRLVAGRVGARSARGRGWRHRLGRRADRAGGRRGQHARQGEDAENRTAQSHGSLHRWRWWGSAAHPGTWRTEPARRRRRRAGRAKPPMSHRRHPSGRRTPTRHRAGGRTRPVRRTRAPPAPPGGGGCRAGRRPGRRP